ncbi:MAG: hypothetical protein QG573_378, partial [Acidobacteriota bacterium]|nr:hypothetical protein [Acidobacteriota bacterium]
MKIDPSTSGRKLIMRKSLVLAAGLCLLVLSFG